MDAATVKCGAREPDPICDVPCFVCLLQEPKNVSIHRCRSEKCEKLTVWIFEIIEKKRRLDLVFELFR